MRELNVHLVSDNHFFLNVLFDRLHAEGITTTKNLNANDVVFHITDDKHLHLIVVNLDNVLFLESLDTAIWMNENHPYIKVIIVQRAFSTKIKTINAIGFDKLAHLKKANKAKALITTIVLEANLDRIKAS